MPIPYRPKALDITPCGETSPWGINPGFPGLSPCTGQVAYALRTRAPLSSSPKARIPYDLHVLGLPLAFILSQDQTLHCMVSSAGIQTGCPSRALGTSLARSPVPSPLSFVFVLQYFNELTIQESDRMPGLLAGVPNTRNGSLSAPFMYPLLRTGLQR
jgi:hypothetical protein